MRDSHHQTGIQRQNSSSKPHGAQAGLWAPVPHTELKPCLSVKVHFACLKWKHFKLAHLNQCILIPLSPGFSKQGEWLQLGRENIYVGSCILVWFGLIVFFQKAQRKMAMPLTFLAWYFSCIEYPS